MESVNNNNVNNKNKKEEKDSDATADSNSEASIICWGFIYAPIRLHIRFFIDHLMVCVLLHIRKRRRRTTKYVAL